MGWAKRYPEHFKEVGLPAMIAGGLVGAVSPGVGRVSEVQAQSQNQDGVKQAVSALYSP